MNKDSSILVLGHRGMVGSSVLRCLASNEYTNVKTDDYIKLSDRIDLTDPLQVDLLFAKTNPEYIFLCAAKVGGIGANSTFPAQFIRDNLAIETTVIHSAMNYKIKKLLLFGSTCIYPRNCNQPMKEDFLLTGPLEPTNQWYAIAKIAGIKMCEAYNLQYGTNYIACQPTSLYGPGDKYNVDTSHVIPSMILKFHNAKVNGEDSVVLWGNGMACREFLHVDDLADACLLLMNEYNENKLINVGSEEEVTILRLAEMIKETVGYHGRIEWDVMKPNGMPRKLTDSSRIRDLGWCRKINFMIGLKDTYSDFLTRLSDGKIRS